MEVITYCLVNAASTLDYLVGQALYAKLTYFNDVTENLAGALGKDILFDEIVMEMLDNPEILTDSIEKQEALNLLGEVGSNVKKEWI